MGVAEQRSCCMLCKTRHIGKACMSCMRHRRWPMRCVVTTWTRWTPRGWTATMTYEENMVMYATLILLPSAWYGKGVGNAGFASTPLSAGTEMSGVQDCVSGTPIAYINSTDVLICRHSTCLWAWSSSSPLIFLQNTRCSTHAYHSQRQKFCCRRTARVEQFTGCYKTDHQLWTV